MNRTQKGAVMTLSAFLLNVAFLGYLFIRNGRAGLQHGDPGSVQTGRHA
jgi:hypothetical protein